MASFDGTTFPAHFVVPARVAKGALVRAGVELDTPLVKTCMPGMKFVVTETATNAKGTLRLHITSPIDGWVSEKSVDFVEAPAEAAAPPPAAPEPIAPPADGVPLRRAALAFESRPGRRRAVLERPRPEPTERARS